MNETAQRRGDVIIVADAVGTVAFTITAIFAAVVFTTAAQWVGAITAMGLFAVGVFTFLWAFYNAVQRSRAEQLSVMQLFFLAGAPTPRRVRWIMNLLLLAQVVVGLSTALARPNGPDGSPGSSLAVGILVPMFGIGLNGLWAAFHGEFPELDDDRRREAVSGVEIAEDSDAEIAEQSDAEPGGESAHDLESDDRPEASSQDERSAADGVAASGGTIDQNGRHG